jgi:hypothetical protein
MTSKDELLQSVIEIFKRDLLRQLSLPIGIVPELVAFFLLPLVTGHPASFDQNPYKSLTNRRSALTQSIQEELSSPMVQCIPLDLPDARYGPLDILAVTANLKFNPL